MRRQMAGERWAEPEVTFPKWSRRRTVENVLFVALAVLLFGSAVKRAHERRHQARSEVCSPER